MWNIQNNNYTSYLAGKVYVAPLISNIPTLIKWSNEAAIETYIEANATFTRFFGHQGLEITQDFKSKIASIKWDECDYQEIKYVKPWFMVKFDYLENLDLSALWVATWNIKVSIDSSPVAVTWEAKGTGWTVGQPIKATNKNWANTQVASLVVKAGWSALTLNTNYSVYVWNWTNGDLGFTYVVPLTTSALAITFDYSYTPNATEYQSEQSLTKQLPQLIVKIVWCPDSNGKYNTHYLVNCSMIWELTKWFVDLAEAGKSVSSPISFEWNYGWFVIDKVQRI